MKSLPLSPVVTAAPAKRVVLFVGDGLRADKCFELKEDGTARAPFLKRMARNEGSWGISHTRVPTESRPGHVAMIAGFYEDVSAVTKGWKNNPVEFDHLLDRANKSFAFGAPEIIQLFPGDNVEGHWWGDDHHIDFSSDPKIHDKYSFDGVKDLFNNPQKHEHLNEEGIFIFIHLLGLDTNGHAHGPHSQQYLENIEYVDKGIEETVAMIDSFYGNDGKTAYIFNSDHGMSDAGTHGDGNPDCTRCPLIVWGAGILGPQSKGMYGDDDAKDKILEDLQKQWKMDDLVRRDVNQADLVPFMSILLGRCIPTNSEGVLPLHLLDLPDKDKISAAATNLKQILNNFKAKEELIAASEPFLRPYKFSGDQIENLVLEISRSQNFTDSIVKIDECFQILFEGMKYYQRYDWLLLRSIITFGFVGWMFYSLMSMASLTHQYKYKRLNLVSLVFSSIGILFSFYLYAKSSPVQYYAYVAFPLYFWHQISQTVFNSFASLKKHLRPSLWLIAYVSGLYLLVCTFFERSLLSKIIPVNALLSDSIFFQKLTYSTRFLVGFAQISISLFTLMEPIKEGNVYFLLAGIIAILSFCLITKLLFIRTPLDTSTLARSLLLIFTGAIVVISDIMFKKQQTNNVIQLLNWTILAFSVSSPFFRHENRGIDRLADILLMISPAYLILSISYELLFLCCFSAQSIVFLQNYKQQQKRNGEGNSKKFSKENHDTNLLSPKLLFLSFNFLCCTLMAFFGTGNFASISSFSLPSVYRLVTVFSPFLMSALLIIKILLPFIILSASFGVMLPTIQANKRNVMLIAISTMDIMTVHFFFLVRVEGSWLDIGVSISHFIISSLFSLMALFVFNFSAFLVQ